MMEELIDVHGDAFRPGVGVQADLLAEAVGSVIAYIETRLEKTDERPNYDVYVVWFAKTLQNWKALLSTTLPDGMYYEVTYNGNQRETYIDAYKKFDNVCIPDAVVS
jgi:hypothetical protein